MESLKQSFKSLSNKISELDYHGEKQPILFDHQYMTTSSADSSDRKDVVVKIDDNDNDSGTQIWRESSYDFLNDRRGNAGKSDAIDEFNFQQQTQKVSDDPPSKLIGQFLHKQKASGDFSLDMDLEMDELVENRTLPIVEESPNEPPKVSFQDSPSAGSGTEIAPEPIRRRKSKEEDHQQQQVRNQNRESPHSVGVNNEEVLKCTSNASFKRNSSFLRTKTTKSRLMDPPSDRQDKKSGRVAKSGQLKSGFLGRPNDEDEEDPFADEDLPEKYKKAKFSTLTVLQWLSLILILGALVCSLTIHELTKRTLWALPLWKWELLVLVLICGRLVSGWGIRLVVFFIERNFILRKRVLYFVYGLRKAVQNCLWLGLVLLAWHYLFDKKVEREVKSKTLPFVITKILICLLVGTLLWLVKTLLVKVLASSFHVSTYFDRIQDSLFNQYVIETLSGPPLIEIQKNQEEEEEVIAEVQKLQNAGATIPADLKATALPPMHPMPPMKSGRVIGSGGLQSSPRVVGKSNRASGAISDQKDEGITIDQLHKLNQKNVSAWNMKRLMNIVRHGVLSTLDEQIQNSHHEDESATKIRSEFEAKCAARKIFNNVAKPQSKFIYLEDVMRFMREDEALKIMSLFEGETENKGVSKKSLKNWVVNAFRERRALALTLDDTKTAVNQLHRMVNVVMGIIIVVIWLLILGIATTQFLVVISSQLLLVVFMFGNTAKMAFEAIVFLFVMHPFDVGDRCEVEGVQMVVEEMNILTTVFLRFDNQKIIYPNSVLSTKPISNYYRSPDMGDAIDFCIHISTPAEKIAIMKKRLTAYIEKNTEHWYPAPMIVVRDVDDMNRLKFSVWLTHRMNHQNMGERWTRRALVVEEMIKILRELDIEYRMLPLDVNLRNMPGLSSTRLPSNWTACNY
ncbi:Mechanosensitive ion channel MscS [Macleaya cordata]|uniref:Mechanosensitive ion channel protein n=1 Tax=Macleaya cordata TaxID=56857 RepID=A0A200QZT5_MACCD|nr:Mechanosensitive ion channel MscS [Macleaya cordata]